MKCPFSEQLLSDLLVLDLKNKMDITPARMRRLLGQFNKRDVFTELQDYYALSESHTPSATLLEDFWAKTGDIKQPVHADSGQHHLSF